MNAGKRSGSFLLRWLRRAVVTVAIVLATIVLFRAFEARRPPGLKPWHRFVPPSEVRAVELTASFTLEDYLRREDQIFREVREQIEDRLAPEDRTNGNRYFAESASSPRRYPQDWNRTFEMVPPEVRGGALLVHGLDGLSLQHAPVRRDPARSGLLRPRPARARPRHRARRPHGGDLAGLARGRARGRAARAAPRRRPEAARPGRLLQRGGALGQVRARRPGTTRACRRPTGSSSCRR